MFSTLYRRRAESLRSLVPIFPSLTCANFPFCSWSNKSTARNFNSSVSDNEDEDRISFLQVDVIVVGGGLSGLAAAKYLHDAGVEVLILEAKNRVGGRTLSKKSSKTGVYVDLGGSYVGPTQNHIRKLATELDIERFEIDDYLPWIYYTNGSKHIFNKFNLPRFWNPIINLDLKYMFYRLDKMAEEIPLDNPWLAPHAKEWDQMTMRTFAKRYLWTKAARNYLERIIVGRLTSSKPQEVSMLWFLWLIKQGYKCDFIFTASQNQKFTEGAQSICNRIAVRLRGRILLDKAVVQINQDDAGITVSTLGGRTYYAKHVIMAIPLNFLMKIHFRPPLPSKLNQLIERVFMGIVIKSVVFYKNAFWREKGFSGAVLVGDEKYPFSQILDDSNPDNSNPALTALIIGDDAFKLMSYPRNQRLHLICKSLGEIFESTEALKPLHYEEKLWSEEQYTGGSYSAVYPPGGLTTYGSILRKNVGRVYFAGTETALRWSGFMDGAVSAGERAAKEVLAHMGKLSVDEVWKDSLEEKNLQCLLTTPTTPKKNAVFKMIVIKFLKVAVSFFSLMIFIRVFVRTGTVSHPRFFDHVVSQMGSNVNEKVADVVTGFSN